MVILETPINVHTHYVVIPQIPDKESLLCVCVWCVGARMVCVCGSCHRGWWSVNRINSDSWLHTLEHDSWTEESELVTYQWPGHW